jgi:acyl carrier protein
MNAPLAASIDTDADLQRYRIIISEVLSEVLEIGAVKEDSLYVDLGGNSLNIMHVLLKIEQRAGILMNPDVFFHPTDSTVIGLAQSLIQHSKR